MRTRAVLLVASLTIAGCSNHQQTYFPPDFAGALPDLTAPPAPDLAGMDLAGMDLAAPPPDLAVADDLSVPADLAPSEDLAPAQDMTQVQEDLTPVQDMTPVLDLTPSQDMTPVQDMTPPAPCGVAQAMLCANGQPCGGAADCLSGICSGAGLCVECVSPSTCPGVDSECHTRTCDSNVCGAVDAPATQALVAQNPGDCQKLFCNGSGGTRTTADDTDLPTTANECKRGICTVGVPTFTNKVGGSACTAGGLICDGAGACINENVWVSTVAATTANSVATSIQVRGLDGALANVSFTNPLPMPQAASGANEPFTLLGNSTYEGGLTRSEDGRYVVMGGYAAAPGANVNSTTNVTTRIVARIDKNGVVDTTTKLSTNAFYTSPIRGAASVDGSAFWVSGDGNQFNGNPTGGVHYVVFGDSASTYVVNAPSNSRRLGIFGGKLYGSSGSGASAGILQYSVALPTSAGASSSLIPGMASGTSPVSFVMLSRGGSGIDTLYVADDRAIASGGGLMKWTFSASTWTRDTNFVPTGLTNGLRGLTGFVSNGNAFLVAIDASSSTRLLLVIDDGTNTPAVKVLATASSSSTPFRGVALAPTP